MKSVIKATLNFYIYSSVHISIAALCFSTEIFFILDLDIQVNFLAFVFAATTLTYSLHRLIGLSKVSHEHSAVRFDFVSKNEFLIKSLVVVSSLVLLYLLISMHLQMIIHFAISGLISFLYVLPVMQSKKRLRDIPYIKIILIAIVWAYVACIPALTDNEVLSSFFYFIILIFFEKLVYIFLITVPFDVRDYEIDKSMSLKTIPQKIGLHKSYKLIYRALFLNCFIWLILNIYLELSVIAFLLILASQVLTFFAIKYTENKLSDIYYSGLLDGMITIRSLIVIAAFSMG